MPQNADKHICVHSHSGPDEVPIFFVGASMEAGDFDPANELAVWSSGSLRMIRQKDSGWPDGVMYQLVQTPSPQKLEAAVPGCLVLPVGVKAKVLSSSKYAG